jgi:hypothetical protein
VIFSKSDYFQFDFYKKKINKLNFFLQKSKLVQTDWFLLGSVFLGQKPVQTGLVRFFWFDSVLAWFFRFGSVFFPGFFRFGSVFRFQAYKTEPNRSVF